MSIQEQHALLPLLGDAQHSPLADLAAAALPIRERIADLERDYAPRAREFWQAILDLLPELRKALQPFVCFHEEHRDIASSLGFPLQILHLQMERTESALLAYLPRCQSFAKSRLQQRHDLLKRLCMIEDLTQQCITIVKNRHEEQAPPMSAPSLLRLARRGPGSLADLDATIALIRGQIADLERDDAPRAREFWQALINHLMQMDQVIQPFFGLLKTYSETTFPLIYPLIFPLHMVDAKIGFLCIMITVHLPGCRSKAKSRVKQRLDLLTLLHTLHETAQQLIAAVTVIEEAQTEKETQA